METNQKTLSSYFKEMKAKKKTKEQLPETFVFYTHAGDRRKNEDK